MSIYLEAMYPRQVLSANYITLINPTLYPDRILQEHNFLYMIDGSWEIREGDEIFTLHEDDLLILPGGRHHYGTALSSPNNRHMYIHAEPTVKESAWNLSGAPMPESDTAIYFHSVIHCQNNPQIRKRFEEIISVCLEHSVHRNNKLSLLMSLFLCEIVEQQQKSAYSTSYMITEKIIHLLQITPQKFFTSKELSKIFFVSERTLNNYFKKTYGKTLYNYQMELKLEMVRRFLINYPCCKLQDISLNFGFYDEFHLSKVFKSRHGFSPSIYRQDHLK